MQGLRHFVREVGVFLYAFSKCGAPYEIGMEAEGPAFRLEGLAIILYPDYLSGGQTYHRAFLIVVVTASVYEVAAFHVLQEQGIKPERMSRVTYTLCFGEVYDADQRVQCLDAEQPVIVGYTGYVQYFVLHISLSAANIAHSV